MAQIVLTNAQVLINAVDLSAAVESVKINYKADTPENTTMGAASKSRLPGLKDWDIDITFNQDWAAAQADATLFPLVGAAAFVIEIRPVAAARSVTNPAYQSNSALLAEYTPIGNKVGEVAKAPIKLVGAGVLNRLTA